MKNLNIAFAVLATTTLASAQVAKQQPVKRQIPAGTPLVFAPAPLVGGADSCVTPDVVVGTGPFAFDNTAATTGTDGQAETICLLFGSTAVTRDVWFTWNATLTGNVVVSACNLTAVDTKIAVYQGLTCPTAGTALACNDDNCVVFESATQPFAVTAGQDYVIQIGTYPFPAGTGAAGGTGQFQIVPVIVPTNDSCTTPDVLAGPGAYPFDQTLATTGVEGQTESLCNFVGSTAVENDLWYTYTATTNGTATVTTCGLTSVLGNSDDTKIGVYSGVGCPVAGSAIACNDDDPACAGGASLESTVSWPTTCGTTYLIQLGQYFGGDVILGTFNVAETGSACATPVTYFCFGDGTGLACPCANSGAVGNGCANSLNVNGGNLAASGNASVSGDTWLLSGSGIPNGPGLYYQAVNQLGGGNGVVFGDGIRCIGGSVIRLGIVTASGNASTYPTGVTPPNNIAISVKGFNLAGDVRNYQLWYRDSAIGFCSASVFNLTNAVNVTWQP